MPVDLQILRALRTTITTQAADELADFRANLSETLAAFATARENAANERRQANEYLTRMHDATKSLMEVRIELARANTDLDNARAAHQAECRAHEMLRADFADQTRSYDRTITERNDARARLAEATAREERRCAALCSMGAMPDESRPFLDKALIRIEELEEQLRQARDNAGWNGVETQSRFTTLCADRDALLQRAVRAEQGRDAAIKERDAVLHRVIMAQQGRDAAIQAIRARCQRVSVSGDIIAEALNLLTFAQRLHGNLEALRDRAENIENSE